MTAHTPAMLLVVTKGPDSGRVVRLDPTQPLIVGRINHHLQFIDTAVSRRHAQVWFERGRWRIMDNASSTGTFVNGVRLAGWVELLPGDRVLIGRNQLVAALMDEATPREPTTRRRWRIAASLLLGAGVGAAGMMFTLDRQALSDAAVERLNATLALRQAEQRDAFDQVLARLESQRLDQSRLGDKLDAVLTQGSQQARDVQTGLASITDAITAQPRFEPVAQELFKGLAQHIDQATQRTEPSLARITAQQSARFDDLQAAIDDRFADYLAEQRDLIASLTATLSDQIDAGAARSEPMLAAMLDRLDADLSDRLGSQRQVVALLQRLEAASPAGLLEDLIANVQNQNQQLALLTTQREAQRETPLPLTPVVTASPLEASPLLNITPSSPGTPGTPSTPSLFDAPDDLASQQINAQIEKRLTDLQKAYREAFETDTSILFAGRMLNPREARSRLGVTRWEQWYLLDQLRERQALQQRAREHREERTTLPPTAPDYVGDWLNRQTP